MKILVCVKQVPFQEAHLEIDPEKKWVRHDDELPYAMNRYDEYAMEAAMVIKETLGDVTVDGVSVGPARAESTVRKAIAFGAEKGVHIVLAEDRPLSPMETASLIAAYAKDHAYDLILAGVMAEDDMQCLVGPMTAKIMGIPCRTAAMGVDMDKEQGRVTVRSELEGGFHETAVMTLPALVTVQSGINIPRYPALSNVLRSKSQPLVVIPAEDLSPPSPRQTIETMALPQKPGQALRLSGTPEEKAAQLLTILHEKSFL